MLAHIAKDGRKETVNEHCFVVAEMAKDLGDSVGLGHVAFLSALLHDIGKNRLAFEEYLIKATTDPKSVKRGCVDHSTAGSKYIFEHYYKGDMIHRLTAQIIAVAICSHHGLYDIFKSDGTLQFLERLSQNESLDYEMVLKNSRAILDYCNINAEFEVAVQEVLNYYRMFFEIEKEYLAKKKTEKGEVKNFMVACLERLISSILIQSDRVQTAAFMSGVPRQKTLNEKETWDLWKHWIHVFDKNIQKEENKSDVGRLRGRLLKECTDFVGKAPGIYTLEIPTGGGKTFSGLRYALGHAAKYQKNRIFYVSPLLSVLEQNALAMKKQLSEDENQPDQHVEKYILEHHSNIIFGSQDEDSDKAGRYQQLVETWDSPFIMTTLVQFLNTLFDDSTQCVRRMHQLCNAVIIIDEIQSLPIKCVYLFNMMMNFLSRCCGATVILCSATQPLLGEVKKSILYSVPDNMISDRTYYEKAFKRVEIIPMLTQTGAIQNYGTEDLVDFLMKKLNRNILIILNTKSAVRKLYKAITKRVKQNEKVCDVRQLTTYMCAGHRIDKIEEIKDKLKLQTKELGKPLICISTQLLEAGVDISFECVIRSLAGLDNIAQAAGRCNRNGEVLMGQVYVLGYSEENLSKLPDIKAARDSMEKLLFDYHKAPQFFDNELLSRKAMDRYYEYYFSKRENEMGFSFKYEEMDYQIYDVLAGNIKDRQAYSDRYHDEEPDMRMHQAFKRAGKAFEVIGNATISVIVPYGDGKTYINQLWEIPEDDYKNIKRVLKYLQRYTINIYPNDTLFNEVKNRGAIEKSLLDGEVYVLSESFYNEDGLSDELKFKSY